MMLCAGTTSYAQTPDGQTPAVETGCDSESGAAFGLCNAYCEAMDCDSEDTQASPKACVRVLAQFEKIMGYEMPQCVGVYPQAGEACTLQDQTITFVPSEGPLYGCTDDFTFTYLWCHPTNLEWACTNGGG